MAFAAPTRFGEPLGEMNTTPLIDVMLVLLIMFIMAVPLASHSLEFELPSSPQKPHLGPIKATNSVTLSAQGQIAWNGVAQSEADLAATLVAATHTRPEPLVLFQPEGGAAYGQSARVLRIIKMSGLTGFGFVGNEQYGDFAKAEPKR